MRCRARGFGPPAGSGGGSDISIYVLFAATARAQHRMVPVVHPAAAIKPSYKCTAAAGEGHPIGPFSIGLSRRLWRAGCAHVLGITGKIRSVTVAARNGRTNFARVRSRAGITCAFRPNRLLTRAARHAHFDRAATVRERSRSFETFDQPIFARCLRRRGSSLVGQTPWSARDALVPRPEA